MSYGPEVANGEPKLANVVRQLTVQHHHKNSLVVADSKFESYYIMEKGREEWGIAFCMSQAGNPVCHPEQWRSKKSAYWKNLKKHSTRGDYVECWSKHAHFLMSRDSSVLRVVNNDLPASEEERLVRVWDKQTRHWGGIRKIMAPMPVHFYKSFYGLVDVHNGLRARYGLDWSTRRKMFRVITIMSKKLETNHFIFNQKYFNLSLRLRLLILFN